MKKCIVSIIICLMVVALLSVLVIRKKQHNEQIASGQKVITQSQSINLYHTILNSIQLSYDDNGNPIYPDYYGGAYLDSETNGLIVKVKNISKSDRRRIYQLAGFRTVCDTAEIRLEDCDVSYNELQEIMNKLTQKLEFFKSKNIVITSIAMDEKNSQINMGVEKLSLEQKEYIKKIMQCDFLEIEEGETFLFD